MTETIAKKNWLRLFSPCILASIFSVLAIIVSLVEIEKSEGWSFIVVLIVGPMLCVFIVLDLILKLIVKNNNLIIWVVEICILLLTYWLYIKLYI